MEYCTHCDRPIIVGPDTREMAEGYYLCQECFDEHYTECWGCEGIYPQDECTEGLCIHCTYHACSSCGLLMPTESIDGLCKDCRAKVHNYSYKPTPIFWGEGPLYIGIEIEVDREDPLEDPEDVLLEEIADPAYYFKADGSLNYGFEIVTHPMSYEFLKNTAWRSVFNRLEGWGYSSEDNDTCGLHIHLSKNYLGETEWAQDRGTMAILYLYEKFWGNMKEFSRRKSNREIDKWAANYGTMQTTELLNRAKGWGRYHAVNIQNKDTVEFRIAKGTLSEETLLATVEFHLILFEIAKTYRPSRIQSLRWGEICTLAKEKQYLSLVGYLKSIELWVEL